MKERLGNPYIRYTELSFKEPGDDGLINRSAHNTRDMVYDSPVVIDWLLKQRRTP